MLSVTHWLTAANIKMSDFIFSYYIKWSSDFKFSIFLSRSSIFANRRSVSAEIDALDEISTSKTDINFANPDLKFVSCILFNFNTWIDMTVIYLTDSHVCLASSTAFEKIELFFRQQGWIQTDGWIEKFKKKIKKILRFDKPCIRNWLVIPNWLKLLNLMSRTSFLLFLVPAPKQLMIEQYFYS